MSADILAIRREDLEARGFRPWVVDNGVAAMRRAIYYEGGAPSVRHAAGWFEPLPGRLLAEPEPGSGSPRVADGAPAPPRRHRGPRRRASRTGPVRKRMRRG